MVRLPDAAGQLENAGNARNARGVRNIRSGKNVKNVTEMPVKVLRGFFAGIGQLLLAADRFRAEEARREGITQDEQYGPPPGLEGEAAAVQMTTVDYVRSAEGPDETATPARGRHRKPADSATGTRPGARRRRRGTSPRQFRSLDATGNVRLLTPDMPAESTSQGDRQGDRPAAKAHSAKAKRIRQKAELPVPGYDGLSLPSLRSRLRNLDAKQLRILLEHERSAANRSDVVTMFERRIAKLEAGPDAS